MVTETNGLGMTALLATNTDLEIVANLAAILDRHLNQLTNALHIEDFERVVLQDARIIVHWQELVLGVFS